MAPRNSKRREIIRTPIPVWVPLPRPCLRSLQVPGPPYYLPISPGTYLPPWAVPPSYYTKPICHCAHEDFCTTSTCKNSKQCVKIQPIFCPHGVKRDGTSELPRNVRENNENNDDDEISSDSDISICFTCGGNRTTHKDKSRLSDTKNTFRQNIQTKPKLLPTQDSFTSSHNVEQSENGNLQNNYNGCGNSFCKRSLSHSSAQEYNSKSSRNYKISVGSKSDYAENTDSSLDRNVSIPPDTYKKQIIATNSEFGCNSCIEPTNGHTFDDLSSTHNGMPKANVSKTNNLKTDTVHIDQLPEQLSKARKNKDKKNGCCLSGSGNICKMSTMALDEKPKPVRDIIDKTDSSKRSEYGSCSAQKHDETPLTATTKDEDDNTSHVKEYNNTTDSSKQSKCGNCSSQKPDKTALTATTMDIDERTGSIRDINNITDSSKRSEYGSSSAQKHDKTPLTATTKDKDDNTRPIKDLNNVTDSRKRPECRCYSIQKPDQRELKTHQISDCRCSSKLLSKESFRLRNVSKCDCSSINSTRMQTSRSHKMTDCECFCKRVSQYECCRNKYPNTSSTQLLSKTSYKSAKNVLSNIKNDVTDSVCECKFPPAYEHLSCKRNSDNCKCTNNK